MAISKKLLPSLVEKKKCDPKTREKGGRALECENKIKFLRARCVCVYVYSAKQFNYMQTRRNIIALRSINLLRAVYVFKCIFQTHFRVTLNIKNHIRVKFTNCK